MLEKLLAEIRAGGPLETGTLAKKLDTSPKMVEAMLMHLQQTGHIRAYQSCNDGCDGCALKGECDPASSVRLWQQSDNKS
jgi:hypothetical protein